MGKSVAFIVSPARKTVFINTFGNDPVFLTSKRATSFLSTFASTNIFITGGKSVSFVNTFNSVPIFTSSSKAVAFLTTVDTGTPRNLKLKIGTLEVGPNETYVVVPDATGEYNPAEPNENPGGYTPELDPTEQYRPKRSQVHLWTVYRIHSKPTSEGYGEYTQTPSTQTPQDDVNYEYTLTLPEEQDAAGVLAPIKGVYEIILIAAPRFTAIDSNGAYVSNTSGTYDIINGENTAFSDTLSDGDFLYYIDSSNGDLYDIEQIDKVFDGTSLNLVAPPANIPPSGTKLYGSGTAISPLPSNSGGVADGLSTGQYNIVYGDNTYFETFFFSDQYLYYISAGTANYVELGRILQVTSEVSLNLYSSTGESASSGDSLVASNTSLSLINSNGLCDSDVGITIYGNDTEFTLFTPGQYLYYRDGANDLVLVGTIDAIISDTEIELTDVPDNIPPAGVNLYASDNIINPLSLPGGSLSSVGAAQNYYTLTGDGTSFTGFANGDFIILSDGQEYNTLGQIGFVQNDTSLVLYSVNNVDVTPGLFILSSNTPISLIDTEGTFSSYETGTYYNVEGDATEFLTTAQAEQYLFYYFAGYNLMGQIFKVYDDLNVWLYEAPTGTPTPNVSPLFTSFSIDTQNEDYANYIGNTNLYYIASQYPGWYVTSVGIMIDDAVTNCIQNMRYKYLQAVMCGECDDEYPTLYAYYVGMLESMNIQEWDRADEFYKKIKEICVSNDDGCSSCNC